MGLWTLHFHTVSTYTWKSKDRNTKYKVITNLHQKYRRNTYTCTHILSNHHFINILCTPICCHPQRANFREYIQRTVTWNIHFSFWEVGRDCIAAILLSTGIVEVVHLNRAQPYITTEWVKSTGSTTNWKTILRQVSDKFIFTGWCKGRNRLISDACGEAQQSTRWKFCHISRSVWKTCFFISALLLQWPEKLYDLSVNIWLSATHIKFTVTHHSMA
jgi:hypothetical protein